MPIIEEVLTISSGLPHIAQLRLILLAKREPESLLLASTNRSCTKRLKCASRGLQSAWLALEPRRKQKKKRKSRFVSGCLWWLRMTRRASVSSILRAHLDPTNESARWSRISVSLRKRRINGLPLLNTRSQLFHLNVIAPSYRTGIIIGRQRYARLEWDTRALLSDCLCTWE